MDIAFVSKMEEVFLVVAVYEEYGSDVLFHVAKPWFRPII
jgi:hypothetical protein